MDRIPLHLKLNNILKRVVLIACVAFAVLFFYKLGEYLGNKDQVAELPQTEIKEVKTNKVTVGENVEPPKSSPVIEEAVSNGSAADSSNNNVEQVDEQVKQPEPVVETKELLVENESNVAEDDNGKMWRIRYANCKSSDSCDNIAADLLQNGIETEIAIEASGTVYYWIRVGPWSDSKGAQEAADLLRSEGIFTSHYQGKKGHYVKTISRSDLEAVNYLADRLEEKGYTKKVINWRSSSEIFYVYEKKQYHTIDEINARSQSLKNQGIENIYQIVRW